MLAGNVSVRVPRGSRGDSNASQAAPAAYLAGRALVTSRRERLAGPKHTTPRSHSPDSTSFFGVERRRSPRSAASFCGDGQSWTLAHINAPDHPVLWVLERRWVRLDLAATARCDAARPCFDQLEHVCSVDQWYCLDACRADRYVVEARSRRLVLHRTGGAAPCRPKGWNAALLAASST